MNLSMKQKQTHKHREQTCGCQGGEGRDCLLVWDWQTQPTIFRMDKQQSPAITAQGNMSWDKPQWKRIFKMNVCVCVTESLCCAAEISTTL